MARDIVPPAAPDVRGDLVLAVQALSAALGERVLEAVRHGVDERIRYNDGYVFQHLLAGALTITELAGRLGVTQQAASKQVADLRRRGLVRSSADPGDGRARRVTLTGRARAAVDAGRASRAALTEEAAGVLGATRARRLLADLDRLAQHHGAWDLLLERRLQAEADR
jgi:DNA-binding MarR family transcriptional regulator